MAKIKCPKCGYTESDARPHDRETYYELCLVCAPKPWLSSQRKRMDASCV
jgi:hypothetical protein